MMNSEYKVFTLTILAIALLVDISMAQKPDLNCYRRNDNTNSCLWSTAARMAALGGYTKIDNSQCLDMLFGITGNCNACGKHMGYANTLSCMKPVCVCRTANGASSVRRVANPIAADHVSCRQSKLANGTLNPKYLYRIPLSICLNKNATDGSTWVPIAKSCQSLAN